MNPVPTHPAVPPIGSRECDRPAWQLPPGVPRGAWDYANTSAIADQYDTFHDGHPLLEFDRRVVLETAEGIPASSPSEPRIALDLGCGTGRSLIPLAERGWRTLGVDLSRGMLHRLSQKQQDSPRASGSMALVQGNLAQLEWLKEQSIDLALCLYSSLGMLQGRRHRRAMLTRVQRALRPEGRVVVHVHNRGIWFREPNGWKRVLADRWRSLRDPLWEYGDRVSTYRGLPSMYLHIYSERELRQDLRSAGLRVERWIHLNIFSSGELSWGAVARHFRAGGFLVVAQRSPQCFSDSVPWFGSEDRAAC